MNLNVLKILLCTSIVFSVTALPNVSSADEIAAAVAYCVAAHVKADSVLLAAHTKADSHLLAAHNAANASKAAAGALGYTGNWCIADWVAANAKADAYWVAANAAADAGWVAANAVADADKVAAIASASNRIPHPGYQPSPNYFKVLHYNDAYIVQNTEAFMYEWLNREETGKTLKLFSGDQISPSLASSVYKGAQFDKFFEKAELDFAVIGNHELDFGEQHFIDLFANKPLPVWLMANIKNKTTGNLLGNAVAYDWKMINGIKIGVFGLADQDWISSSRLDMTNYIYEDFQQKAVEISHLLKSKGADIVVLVSHMINSDDRILLNDPDNDIDIIFGGHDHEYVIERVSQKLLVKSGVDFLFLSDVRIELNSNPLPIQTRGNNNAENFSYLLTTTNDFPSQNWQFSLKKSCDLFLNIKIEKVDIDIKNGPKDADLVAYDQQILSAIISTADVPLFKLSNPQTTLENIILAQETSFTDFLADVVRSYTNADVAIVAMGLLRTSEQYDANYLFTVGDADNLLPIPDVNVLLNCVGSDLFIILEFGLALLPVPADSFSALSGPTFSFNTANQPVHRIDYATLKIGGQAFDLNAEYIISAGQYAILVASRITGFPTCSPVASSLTPKTLLNLLNDFASLPQSDAFRDEFVLFKANFQFLTINDLVKYDQQSSTKKYDFLNEIAINRESIANVLKFMTVSAMIRLKYYTLADSIEIINAVPVFVISPKIDGRMTKSS